MGKNLKFYILVELYEFDTLNGMVLRAAISVLSP